MIRRSTISLNETNSGKLSILDNIITEYNKAVNFYIDILWLNKEELFELKFVPKVNELELDSSISARLKQCAAKQALSIIKSQKKNKEDELTKPTLNKFNIELDSRCVTLDLSPETKKFDIWIHLESLGNKIKLNIPSKKHFHFNGFKDWELKKSIRIRKTDLGFFADLYFQRKNPVYKTEGKTIGIDVGYKKLIIDSDNNKYDVGLERIYEKISRKKRGSKSFKRALKERDCAINVSVKQIDLSETKHIIIEALCDVKKGSKNNLRKQFVNKLQRWSYPKIFNKLEMICELSGVQITPVDPKHTSQICSSCGQRSKKSRNGEFYKCVFCGFEIDSDHNAALNILHRGFPQKHIVSEC